MVTNAMRPALREAYGNAVSTATKLVFPNALALIKREADGTEKSYIVANTSGVIINSSGGAEGINVTYPEGSSGGPEHVSFNRFQLNTLAAAGLTNDGTPFATTAVTLEEYNSMQLPQLSTKWEW